MYASTRVREVERRAASACDFETSVQYVTKSSEGAWGVIGSESDGGGAVPTSLLEGGTTIRVAPMERSRGGWDDEHFHDKLRVPEGSSAGRGLVVTLEAMARECVTVALSPHPYFDMGKTYAIHLGAAGNLSTVIRRRLPSGNEAIDSTFPGRICTDDRFTSYWIVLQDGVLSAGVGTCPGKKCIATLDDRLYHQLRSGVDACKFVGIGNSALGRHARDLKVRNVSVMPLPSLFGMGGVPVDKVEAVNIDQDDSLGASSAAAPDAELLSEYKRECAKAKARAEKFGTEYKQPPPDAFFKWSEARRLRANPEKGFVTGIDVMSAEEKAKAERRKARFAEDEKNRKRERGDDVEEGEDAKDNMDEAEAGKGGPSKEDENRNDPILIEHSWDNEDLVVGQRFDPPQHLWTIQPDPEAPGDDDKQIEGDAEEEEEKAVLVPEKVHIFSIDWAAFKQIRSDDIMAHFAVYGPSYVEWLGELSCNVHFEDKFSAARALAGMSKEIPSPPPEIAVKNKQDSMRNQVSGKTADGEEENAMATVEKEDSAEVEDSVVETRTTEGVDPSAVDEKQITAEREDDIPPPSDLGAMGWRLAHNPVRKVANDRFGRRGTRARALMRVATSEDVLVERPTEWPRPPPGFTTKRVLGPGSDFDTRWRQRRRGDGGRNKRRRRDGGGRRYNDEEEEERWNRDRYYSDEEYESYDEHMGDYDGDDRDYDDDKLPAALDRGLKSSRAGFSVEEMEAERAARRNAE
eukprot:CAMPEP_0113600338 /NCGR_PEP_ID=MMETSP0015_2-20120614/42653_1 /TAXON_ID=2838 /ORGANISM="Odontella" /LENGTH=745 /DNA_ID=CAMNT_0000508587 /DNA_START=424 /DNA_END=2661 /DNA_ORIENTATION=+ /assembly_acc=CAM_ASM_000160